MEIKGQEVTTLYEAANVLGALHASNTNEVAAALREIAKGFETGAYARTPVTVGIYIEDGIVQGVQASAPVTYFTADADVFEDACAGDIANGTCDDKEHEIDRELHAQEREAYQRYEALPYDAT